MRRLLLAALTLTLALTASTAGAGTFAVVPTSVPTTLPSVGTPNTSISVAPGWTLPSATPEVLDAAQLQALWQQAGAAYGVPWQVLAAINKIESNFGRNMGPSSAGAIGWMQFIPSTWLRWGTDANGDGYADPWNAEDAVYSAARYLAASGGASDIYRAVYAYNHADWYVREVLDLAQVYAQGTETTFAVDQLQTNLQQARERVATVNRTLVAARVKVRRLARIQARWRAREQSARLLSEQLAAGRRAALVGVQLAAAQSVARQIASRLDAAQQALDRAGDAARAASFSPGVGALLDAPTYSSGYVFPVGGGPGVVSVAHTHHDYPAADIAAPEGSPVYALADSVVLQAWHEPDPRCGIGMTIRSSDGQVWTYCHLAYEDPTVQDGATLSAGQSVGLVGATGDATGPHLHLQLQPPTEYPQDESWFEGFAGRAFSWQDTATPEADVTVAATAAAPALQATPDPVPGTVSKPLGFELAAPPQPQQRALASLSGGAPVFAVAAAPAGVVRFSSSLTR
jgi:murein DD-endopeptidase MepM/ murein hydrolase activator NlpD